MTVSKKAPGSPRRHPSAIDRRPAAPRGPLSEGGGRRKSKLTQAGDRAKWETERELLHRTLQAHGWNLTHTAAALEMGHPSAVLAALDRYDLRAEYERHRAT